MADKHLSQVFARGALVTIEFIDYETGDTDSVEVWVSKLTAAEQSKATDAARTASVRRKHELREDLQEAFDDELDIPTQELIDALMVFERQNIQREAYEEVLHNPDVGSNWSEDGFDLLGLNEALIARHKEIEAENEGVDPKEQVQLNDDKEYKRLLNSQNKFFDEVDEVKQKKIDSKAHEFTVFSDAELREKLRDKMIDMEVQVTWYEQFRQHVVYHSIKYPDNRKRNYFQSVHDVEALPELIFDQLWDAYDEIGLSSVDVKK